MNVNEYQTLAAKTLTLEGREALIMATIGLAGEVGELLGAIDFAEDVERLLEFSDFDAVKSEIGDVLWYIAAIATSQGIELGQCFDFDAPSRLANPEQCVNEPEDPAASTPRLPMEAGAIAEQVKKHLWHGKELDRDVLCDHMYWLLDTLSIVAEGHGFTLRDCAEDNIAKLRARRPESFKVDGQ